MTFPWPIWDGTLPDVPPSTTGNTWYADAQHGNDGNDGRSFATAKRTLTAAIPLVNAGDTLLVAGGIYREYAPFGDLHGSASAPVTVGSYGHGTGAPILDGGFKPASWTHYTAQGQQNVWQASLAGVSQISASQPVLGIYVNNGQAESALREVYHGSTNGNPQLYTCPLPPTQDQTNITDGSNNWYYDATANTLYADFGGTLGSGDPNEADLSVLFNSHANSTPQTLFSLDSSQTYLNFVGLTLRASSWNGVYSEASYITFDHCDAKFNGGAGIEFEYPGNSGSVTNNSVTFSRIWMNVLDNWPRFNNGNSSGGWPSALSWGNQSNALAQGNVVYHNGGEGLIVGGTFSEDGHTPHVSVNNVVRNNVIFDNWSVNLYFVSTQNGLADQNYVFQHPLNANDTFPNLLTINSEYGEDWGRRMEPINLSLGDETYGSTFDGQAWLMNITVINNIFVGGKRGLYDYDDGTCCNGTLPNCNVHGLRNDVIANNTFVLGSQELMGGWQGYGWQNASVMGDTSVNSLFENNLIVTASSDDDMISLGASGANPQVTTDFNLFSGPGVFGATQGNVNFMTWQTDARPWDQHSTTGDAMLANTSAFTQTVDQVFVYDWHNAIPASGSPAHNAGTDLSSHFTDDFTNATRPSGSFTIGAYSL